MKLIFAMALLFSSVVMNFAQTNSAKTDHNNPPDWHNAVSIYEFSARRLNSNERVSMNAYQGHVCIIVNVASHCGYTERHYDDLKELYEEYSNINGLRILAFPSNQFLQEPGLEKQIQALVKEKKIKFDMFEKVNVNGDDAHPLWRYLQSKLEGPRGSYITWNFTKFVIDKYGQPVGRFEPTTDPRELLPFLKKYW